jgi:hypothetical protein
MNFEIALRLLKAGHSVRSKKWKKGFYLALANEQIQLFEHGNVCTTHTYRWDILSSHLLSDQWEVIEPMTFYDQGFADGHEAGWDEALARYLKALDHFEDTVPTHENSRSIITNLQENKDIT